MGQHHADAGEHGLGGDRGLLVSVGLNLGFVVVEVVFGVAAGSMALVADAGHT